MKRLRNGQGKRAVFWLLVALLGALAALYPFLSGTDMMGGGYAIVFASFLPIVAGATAGFVYIRRAAVLDAILDGRNLLVHWTYSDEEWRRYVAVEARASKAEKTTLFFVISAFALLFGVGFLVIAPDREAGRSVFLGMVCLIALVGGAALLSVRLAGPRPHDRPGALVSEEGVYPSGSLHTWSLLGARLETVKLVERRRPSLEFTYSYPTRYGLDAETVRVPIPAGEEGTAREVAARLREDTA